ncbi:hypothetical protein B0T22DRAFT_222252 [Podospora appendiculata]|uniref:Uncharacterized protein n=1 Tax=Podospora appendiculata TaxID=314037 RepID=A0AAE0X5Z4_9PEZI|nr:hypothetical protein B0T22DRAFT_222252 [Podospora appendiculata]
MDSHRSGDVASPTTFPPLEAREKTTSADGKIPSTHSARPQPLSTKKMFSARRLFLTFSVCLLVLFGLASASSSRTWQRIPCHGEASREATEPESGPLSLSSLLNAASPKALHELLHKHFPGRYQDGVWPSEREAVEAVHRVDEALATSLLQLAKRDGNSTTVPSSASSSFSESSTSSPSESASTTPPASSTPPPASSSTSSPQPPVSSSTPSSTAKPPAGTSTPPITSSTSQSPSSTSTEPSSTPESQSSTRGTSSKPADSSFSRSRPSSVVDVETTSIGPSSTSQSVSSLSDDGGMLPFYTTLTTSTIAPSTTTMTSTSTSRSLRLVVETFTSTNTNNGAVVTVVQTTYVDPEPAQTGTASSTKSPGSLQNAASKRGLAHGIVAGAVIGAALFV